MKLALVVPALNEEGAIGSTLRRALAARQKVVSATGLTEMVVVFVNDGSTDGTQQVVDQEEFRDVVKVRFERNRGYGAAIKAGWQAVDADLVGFIDGDGTCDPLSCVDLIRRMIETNADVVLAARLNPDSKMPLVRRVGNIIFARLLGLVSGNNLTDTASGFRIVRRASLPLLSPLPDGLHFTPAMSCICLLDPRLRIEEVPMPYEERIGRSKLSVIKDGMRFLYTILFSACCYAPIKTMVGGALLGAIACQLLAWLVIVFGGALAAVFGAAAAVVLILQMGATGVICHQLNFLLIGPPQVSAPAERILQNILHYKRLIVGGTLGVAMGIAGLVIVGLSRSLLNDSAWALLLSMMMLLTIGGGMAMFGGVVLRVIWAVGEKQKSMLRDAYPVQTPQQLGQTAPANATVIQALTDQDTAKTVGRLWSRNRSERFGA